MKRIPGFIEILRAPEGTGDGGGGSTSGGGGGSSTPSPAPDTGGATPSSPSPSSPSGAAPSEPEPLTNEFEGFGAPDLSDDDVFSPTSQPTPQKAPQEQAPSAEAKPPQVSPDAAEQKPPEQQAPAAQPPGPQEAQPQFPTPAEPAKRGAALLANIAELESHLATTPEFQLSEADIEAINTDITTAIPRLLARAHIRAQAAAMNQMEQIVPAIIQKYLTVDKARSESENAFYSRWPDLNSKAHGNLVGQYARMYRSMNPQATREQMIEELGPVIMMAAKVVPGTAKQNGAGGPSGTPPARRQPPASPFQPAIGGGAAPPAQASENPWEGYGAAPDEE